MKKSVLFQLYDRTMNNCLFYEKEGNRKALLNELGCLRGIAYCMEWELIYSFRSDPRFIRMIELQEQMKNELTVV